MERTDFYVPDDSVWESILPLRAASWNMISNVSSSGKAASTYKIGDTKTILLNGKNYLFRIIGFNHDDLADGSGKAGITFEMVDMYSTSRMNQNNTNTGGWGMSQMRQSTLQVVLHHLLPQDLQGVIKPVIKKFYNPSVNPSSPLADKIGKSPDTLFLLSLSEICSSTAITSSEHSSITSYSAEYLAEGNQYEYYQNVNPNTDPIYSSSALVKKLNGSTNDWWLRSPGIGSYGSFRYVTSAGSVSYYSANFPSYGFSFAFCV